VGDANRQPSANQLDQMKALVDESMRQGAVGLLSALIYPPGVYARTSELVELAKTAASHHGVYFTHIRNEGRELLPSVEEAIQIGREAHIPVHIYHDEGYRALRRIQRPRASFSLAGFQVTFIGRCEYQFSQSEVVSISFLPSAVTQNPGKDWSNVLIAEVPAGLDKTYEGKSVTAVSKLRNRGPLGNILLLAPLGAS
jgi:hypothetical protein